MHSLQGAANETRPRYVFFANAERPGPPGETTFYIRHSGSQDVLTPMVAKAFREVDARVAIARLRSLESQLAFDGAPLWMLATLLTLFAGGSLLIAAIGQYAVVAFDGRRRMREFGVRIALGASSRQLVSSVDLRELPPDRSRPADWICPERRRGHGTGSRPLRRHPDRPGDLCQRLRAAGWRLSHRQLPTGATRGQYRSHGRLENRVGRNLFPLSGLVLFVADVFQPIHGFAIELFLDRDVGHGGRR